MKKTFKVLFLIFLGFIFGMIYYYFLQKITEKREISFEIQENKKLETLTFDIDTQECKVVECNERDCNKLEKKLSIINHDLLKTNSSER